MFIDIIHYSDDARNCDDQKDVHHARAFQEGNLPWRTPYYIPNSDTP